MPATPEQLRRLADPFTPSDVEWRIQTAGEKNGKPWARVLAYITNRAIMERLDEVVGPENWKNAFHDAPAGGLMCVLSVCVTRDNGASEWVPKVDGAENTDVEPVKGGMSGAMKRAAVQWGIGRYLYHLEEGWAEISDAGQFSGKTKEGKWFKWNPPLLPTWAMPGGSGKPDGGAPPSTASPVKGSTPSGTRPSPAPPAPAASSASTTPNGVRHAADAPVCPKCGGAVWDNRTTKTNPKAPDYKCRDKACDGCIWPPRDAKPKAAITTPMGPEGDAEWAPVDDEVPF